MKSLNSFVVIFGAIGFVVVGGIAVLMALVLRLRKPHPVDAYFDAWEPDPYVTGLAGQAAADYPPRGDPAKPHAFRTSPWRADAHDFGCYFEGCGRTREAPIHWRLVG